MRIKLIFLKINPLLLKRSILQKKNLLIVTKDSKCIQTLNLLLNRKTINFIYFVREENHKD